MHDSDGQAAGLAGWSVGDRLRFLPVGCVPVVCLLIALMNNDVARAWQPARQSAAWGLSAGNRFVVNTTVVRKSSVQIGELPALESTITDEFEVEYLVFNTSDAGDAIFQATVNPVRRSIEPADEQQAALADRRLPLLRDQKFQLLVGPDGIAEEIVGGQQAMQSLAGLDPQNQQLLLKTCPDDVIRSWFAQPFWLAPRLAEPKTEDSWERIDRHSLGLLGSLTTEVTLTIGNIDERQAAVEITGTSHLIPHAVSDDSEISPLVRFSNVRVDVDDLSGTAVIRFRDPPPPAREDVPPEEGDSDGPDNDADESIRRALPRPWFEEMVVNLSYSGSATVSINGQSSTLKFRHNETRTSKLQTYQIQRAPLLDVPNTPMRLR